jgi:hypothetical protein
MAWRNRWGLSFDIPDLTGGGRGGVYSNRIVLDRNDQQGRAGWSGSGVGIIVPFDAQLPAPPGS